MPPPRWPRRAPGSPAPRAGRPGLDHQPARAARPSSLFVQNPDPGAAALSDHILVDSGGQGSCWYWWPWATRIAPAGDAVQAADRITSVLRASDRSPQFLE